MPIDIANMVVNMGANTFGWITPVSTLMAAFLGSWFAFRFDRLHIKKQQQSDFMLLSDSTFDLIDNLIGFKSKTLPSFNDTLNLVPGVKIFSYFELDNEINKYYFLVAENPKLYNLILTINRYVKFLNDDIEFFNKDSVTNNCQFSIDILNKINKDADNLISFSVSLFIALQACPKKYYSKPLKKMSFLFNFYDNEKSKKILYEALTNTANLRGWDDTKIYWNWKNFGLKSNGFDFNNLIKDAKNINQEVKNAL